MTDYEKYIDERIYENENVWRLNIKSYSKIVREYYYHLTRKRCRSLGIHNFELNVALLPEDILEVPIRDYEKLRDIYKDRILVDSVVIEMTVKRRHKCLNRLKSMLLQEEELLENGNYKDTNPKELFNTLTDFSSFYLEHCFPYSLFEDLLNQLNLNQEDAREVILTLMTPSTSNSLLLHKKLLELSRKKLYQENINLDEFKKNFSFIDSIDLKVSRLENESDIEKAIDRYIQIYGTIEKLNQEESEIEKLEHRMIEKHFKIKNELRSKTKNDKTTSSLIFRLVKLLEEVGVENEEMYYWKNRAFRHFRKLALYCHLDPDKVTIDQLKKTLKKL